MSPLLTLADVSKLLSIPEANVKKLSRSVHPLKYVRVGHERRYRPEDVQAFIEVQQ